MPSWTEFAWAVFLYSAIGGDETYQNIMRQTPLLRGLRTQPASLTVNVIRKNVIMGFLNAWISRVINTQASAQAIQATLQQLTPKIQMIASLDLLQVNLHSPTLAARSTVFDVIAACYDNARHVGYRIGPTASTKLLHLIQPELFVIWDGPILTEYHKRYPHITDSGKGYAAFIVEMQRIAQHVNQLAQPSLGWFSDFPAYLSNKIACNSNPPKSAAKYVDEFNWITITNKTVLPPAWHP